LKKQPLRLILLLLICLISAGLVYFFVFVIIRDPINAFFRKPAVEHSNNISLFSPDFVAGDPIPVQYTCDGSDLSPAIAWDEPPAGTKSFVIVMDDPGSPGGTWTHWLVYNIPAAVRGLPKAISPQAQLGDGSLQGKNSWGNAGYGGPCPPSGTHTYHFKLYALDTILDLPSDATAQALTRAFSGHILAQAELTGTYHK
jgi:Raf kinase inhibitor-like YbhB/YbcL family protein